jgi:hypothetical protein
MLGMFKGKKKPVAAKAEKAEDAVAK